MPGKNGKMVFDEMVNLNSTVKAIFMSGYTDDVVLTKGVQSQLVDFVQKPLSVAGLLSKGKRGTGPIKGGLYSRKETPVSRSNWKTPTAMNRLVVICS